MVADTGILAPGVLTVDLDALAQNYRALRNVAPESTCGAVVKANAYGLGVAPVAGRLWDEGCRHFFVATVREGIELRGLLPAAQIFVFEGVGVGMRMSDGEGEGDGKREGSSAGVIDADLIPVLNSIEQIRQWRTVGADRPAAIHLDTGMSRLGLAETEVREASRTGLLDELNLRYALTHLACADVPADPMNERQARDFGKLLALLPEVETSIGGSAGILMGPRFQGDLVRPGIALYGGSPFAGENSFAGGGSSFVTDDNPLAGGSNPFADGGRAYAGGGSPFAGGTSPIEPVVTLEGVVLQTRTVSGQQTVGYGATHALRSGARLATVGVGYADGYPRALGNRGVACVAGTEVRVVGRVSMDLITLDVSVLAPAEVRPGDTVELLGRNVLLDDLARKAGTISYEILTGLGPRWRRRYLP